MTDETSPKSARSSTTRSPNSPSRSRATAIAAASRSSPSIRAFVARSIATACPPVPTVTSTNASGPCADSSPHTSSTITGTCLRSAASSSYLTARFIESQTELREKFRVQYFFLGGLQHLAESLPVPKLKMILHRRERHFAIQLREVAKISRNQNPSLPIDGHLMRTADKECFERLHPRIEPWLAAQIGVERVPLARGIQRQASLVFVREIRDIKTIVILALQNLAKSGRYTYPTFFIDRMVEPTTKHRLPSPVPHNIPLYPTSVKQFGVLRCNKLTIGVISQ